MQEHTPIRSGTLKEEQPALLLTGDGLVKRYGAVTALDGASLHAAPGEFVALLGPNGAGKSTLFQILSGLFQADGGELMVCGYNPKHEIVAVLAKIGIVFQQMTLDLDLSVRRNLLFHARLHGLTGREVDVQIQSLLRQFNLEERQHQPVRQLSGGFRRKVELARALLHQPRLLLMDEPTVGLDPASRQDILRTVHELCSNQKMATLWATHLVDEAEKADRVVILHHGRVVAEGTPASIINSTGADSLQAAFLKLVHDPKED